MIRSSPAASSTHEHRCTSGVSAILIVVYASFCTISLLQTIILPDRLGTNERFFAALFSFSGRAGKADETHRVCTGRAAGELGQMHDHQRRERQQEHSQVLQLHSQPLDHRRHLGRMRRDGTGVVTLIALPAHGAVDQAEVLAEVEKHIELRGVADIVRVVQRVACEKTVYSFGGAFLIYMFVPSLSWQK